jgi:hypothetical protein
LRRKADRLADLELISVGELAERWHCSPASVRRVLTRANIKPFRLGRGRNGMIRFALIDIDEFLRANRPLTWGEILDRADTRWKAINNRHH